MNKHDTKSQRIKIAVQTLLDELIQFDEKPNGHLKVGPYNFWPGTETITIDGRGRPSYKGLEAFLKILKADRKTFHQYHYGPPASRISNVIRFRRRPIR